MRTRTLAAALGSLIVANSAGAGFTGIEVDLHAAFDTPDQSWHVWRIYATFNNPADTVLSVGGTPGNPLVISTACGPFFQSPAGSDIEHLAAAEPFIEHLEFDSYVTIGSTDTASAPPTSTSGLAGQWDDNSLTVTKGQWFRLPGDIATTQTPTPGGNSGVLIGQFTVPADTTRFSGSIQIGGQIDGAGQTLNGVVWTNLEFGPCCAFDINGDLTVDIDDLIEVILHWDRADTNPFSGPDVNHDGIVNVDDLVAVLLNWGPTNVGYCIETSR